MKNFLFTKTYNGWHEIYNFFGIKLKTKKYISIHFDTVNLYFDPVNGLGNRIFGILNVINYYSPKTINMYWDNTSWVSKSFEELFDVNFDFEINEYSNKDIIKKWKNSDTERTIISPPCTLVTLNKKDISLKYNQISEDDKNEFRKYFEKFKPKQEVQKRIESFTTNDNYIALQVRNAPDWDRYFGNSPLDRFYSELDKYPKDTKFYLCAMSNDISAKFKERYKNQILELPNKDYKSMFDAVADLYILSKAKKSIYSANSTFAELAWWLCKDEQQVTII